MPALSFRALLLACLAFALSACASALNAVTSGAGYSVSRDLAYGPGPRARFDLYVPDGADATTPVVVFFYGGSWDSGSKSTYPFVGQSLASRGVIVAVPDYRLYPQVTFPGFVEDGAQAVGRIAALSRTGGDGMPAGRRPLFLMGHSAGAQIAGLLATDARYLRRVGLRPEALAGFIGLAGPYDFLPLTEERYKRIFPAATRDTSQPVNFVSAGTPPMLLIAGADDTTVDPKNTLLLAAKTKAAGNPVRSTIYPGVDHVGAITALSTVLPFQEIRIREEILSFIAARSGRREP